MEFGKKHKRNTFAPSMHQFVLLMLIYLARVTAWHAIVKKVQQKK